MDQMCANCNYQGEDVVMTEFDVELCPECHSNRLWEEWEDDDDDFLDFCDDVDDGDWDDLDDEDDEGYF